MFKVNITTDRKVIVFFWNMKEDKTKFVIRGIQLINRIDAWYIPEMLIHALLKAIVPLIVIYFSANIINIITYNPNKVELTKTILSVLFIELILFFLKEFINAKLKRHKVEWDVKLNGEFLNVNNQMDYIKLEAPETALLKNKIDSNKSATGAGLNNLIIYMYTFVSSISSVIFAIIMCLDLFKTIAKGSLFHTNGIIITLLYLFVLVTIIFFNMSVDSNLYKKECEQWKKLPETNRAMFYFKDNIKANYGAMDIRIYNWCDRILDEFHRIAIESDHLDNIYRIRKNNGNKKSILLGFFWLITYLILAYEIYFDNVKIGMFIQYSGALTSLLMSFSELGSVILRLSENNKYLADIFDYIDLGINEKENCGEYGEIDKVKNIEFDCVTYSYPSSLEPAVNNISLRLEEGKKYALVGENGSGKTTFIKLLAGLYEPQKGIITINGKNVLNISSEERFRLCSVVFQDYSLFSFSLGQNIAGDSDIKPERIVQIIDKVDLKDKFERMKDGLNTNLFKDFDIDGELLSGGECQKVALARALYKDSPVILLDEPTAAMDPISEADLYRKLNDLTNGKLSVFVSHRLSSCCFCDEIIVFDKGRIVQIGSHKELLSERKGKYYELWTAQAQYYYKECEAVN